MEGTGLRLLIISLGNPGSYFHRLHSAGHHVLLMAQEGLSKQEDFKRTKFGGFRCETSMGPKYKLAMSPLPVNLSGQFVLRAWKEFLEASPNPQDTGLVVVHDDLELLIAKSQVRAFESSARGHNGVRNIHKLMDHEKYPESHLSRFCVGIGMPKKPDGLTYSSVAKYVLSPIGKELMKAWKENSVPALLEHLKVVEEDCQKKDKE